MKITLDIKDSMVKTFLAYIKTLDYVSISGDENIDIPQWQKEEVEKRKEQVENGRMKTKIWSKARGDIFKSNSI